MSENQSEQGQANALVLARTFETVTDRLIAEKDVTREQAALALLATGLNQLSTVWEGDRVVKHLLGIASALADVHGLDPETLEPGRMDTRQ